MVLNVTNKATFQNLFKVNKKVSLMTLTRSSRSQMFFKMGVLKVPQILQENTCVGVSF